MKKLIWLLLLVWFGTAQAKVVVRQLGPEIEVEFQYRDARAGSVVVAGNFNQWSLSAATMVRGADDNWVYVLRGVKSSDVLQYKFVIGTSQRWLLDPEAPDTTTDGRGGMNGQVVVSRFLRSAGSEEIPGDITATGDAAPAAMIPVTVASPPADGSKNLIADASFETGVLDGWTLRGDTAAVSVERSQGNAHSGERSVKYTLGKPFKVLMLKHFSGLSPGNYSFRAWAAGGGGGETTLRLFARDCGGPALSTAIVNSGWQKWRQFTVKGIQVKKSECTIGLYIDAPAGTWGNVDDVEFQEDATWTRLTVEPAR